MTRQMEETIGRRLLRLRRERGLSQRDISGPGVSYTYISRIEAGQRQPSFKAVRAIARRLGVTPEYLETGRDLRPAEDGELRLGEAELRLRLEPCAAAESTVREILADAEAAGEAEVAVRARVRACRRLRQGRPARGGARAPRGSGGDRPAVGLGAARRVHAARPRVRRARGDTAGNRPSHAVPDGAPRGRAGRPDRLRPARDRAGRRARRRR